MPRDRTEIARRNARITTPQPQRSIAATTLPTPPVASETAAGTEPAGGVAALPAAVILEAVGAAAVVRWVSEEAAVRNVLEEYRGAYQELDAEAARRVWPSLDERRLAKAFADLESQRVDFDECRIDIANARSVARCRGRATYVGRVGKRTPQTQSRRWTFELLKTDEQWAIDSVRSQ